MSLHRQVSFVGGETGSWRVTRIRTIVGESLPQVQAIDVVNVSDIVLPSGAKWLLRGIRSNERYTTRMEREKLLVKQEDLGRPDSTFAALIPIRKTQTWWELAQDERRRIFEEISRHIEIGIRYLPTIARRLYHCRDLGENEPFDFLTWFEYAQSDAGAFDQLLMELRASKEWGYVDREIDMRLVRI